MKALATIAAVVRAARDGASKGRPTFKAVAVDDQDVIIGIGSAAHIVDNDDEAVTPAALIGMAYDFCASKAREFRANHDAILDADLVASWPGAPILKSGRVLGAGEELPADDPVVGINIEKGNETHWFVGVRPHDKRIVKAAREGEVVGFSWGGFASKEKE
jgi:Putative phage serine protease XkdF